MTYFRTGITKPMTWNIFVISLVLLCVTLTSVPAQTADKPADLTTLSGKTYKNARPGTVDPDGITYFYSGGVVKNPIYRFA